MFLDSSLGYRPANMHLKVVIQGARTNWLTVAMVTGWEDAGLLLKLVWMVRQLQGLGREPSWRLQLQLEAFTAERV